MREQRTMSEVRSSELETRLLSNGDPVEGDTAVSTPREVRAFYALEEVCGLDADTVGRFKDRFQFLERVCVRQPNDEDRACHFFPGEVCFYKVAFTCGLRFPVHPFMMELLISSTIFFVEDIAQTNRPKLSDKFKTINFRDKSDKSKVNR